MRNKRVIIPWILLIGWMIIIFYMSNQPGEISSKQSELVVRIFQFIGINLTEKLGELATFIVRKVAHFSEYFILYCLMFNVLRFYLDKKGLKFYCLILVFLYACSDEIHQYFIPGRAMAFKDVLIDTSGGVIAYSGIKIYEVIKFKKVILKVSDKQ